MSGINEMKVVEAICKNESSFGNKVLLAEVVRDSGLDKKTVDKIIGCMMIRGDCFRPTDKTVSRV